jgi:hypothetical protein
VASAREAAPLSLQRSATENATIPLGGQDALNPLEVIQIFERVHGRPFVVEFVPEEAYPLSPR